MARVPGLLLYNNFFWGFFFKFLFPWSNVCYYGCILYFGNGFVHWVVGYFINVVSWVWLVWCVRILVRRAVSSCACRSLWVCTAIVIFSCIQWVKVIWCFFFFVHICFLFLSHNMDDWSLCCFDQYFMLLHCGSLGSKGKWFY